MNHFGQSKEGEKSLTLRAYAELQKRTCKQSTEDISLAVNASMQSCGHVLGMMAKRGLIQRETIGTRRFWSLMPDPYPMTVVSATMNRVEHFRHMAKEAKYQEEGYPRIRRRTITLVQLEPMLPPPVHPLDQAWKVIDDHIRAAARRLALVVSNPPEPDAGLTPDS